MRGATTLFIAVLLATAASGQIVPRSAADQVGIQQRIGQQIPLELSFVDERGEPVRLGDLIGDKPVVLTPVYYSCPMLCNLVLDGLVKVARELRLDIGGEYDVISVSFDPSETFEMAEAKKKIYTRRYGRATVEDGWHFLTGEQLEIRQLMDSIGFRYAYDENINEYAHAAVVLVITPEGKIARYFYGFEYQPRDLRLALVEASQGRVGNVVDQVLLLCYSYDPHSGKYTAQVMNILRIMGTATVAALAGFIFVMIRRERKHRG